MDVRKPVCVAVVLYQVPLEMTNGCTYSKGRSDKDPVITVDLDECLLDVYFFGVEICTRAGHSRDGNVAWLMDASYWLITSLFFIGCCFGEQVNILFSFRRRSREPRYDLPGSGCFSSV